MHYAVVMLKILNGFYNLKVIGRTFCDNSVNWKKNTLKVLSIKLIKQMIMLIFQVPWSFNCGRHFSKMYWKEGYFVRVYGNLQMVDRWNSSIHRSHWKNNRYCMNYVWALFLVLRGQFLSFIGPYGVGSRCG